jgi:hypothetical protein
MRTEYKDFKGSKEEKEAMICSMLAQKYDLRTPSTGSEDFLFEMELPFNQEAQINKTTFGNPIY